MRVLSLLLFSTLSLACSSDPQPGADSHVAGGGEATALASGGADRAALEEYKQRIRAELPEVAPIDVEELAARLGDGDAPLLLDVREEEEYAVSHLRGARRAATLAAALVLLEGVARDREIVVYCSIGYRSGHLADELRGAGFTRVRNLQGSIFEWANTGHPVYRDGEVVHEVHPFDETWGRMLDRALWAPDR